MEHGILAKVVCCVAITIAANVNAFTWTYAINGGMAEVYNGCSVAILPKPMGAVTIPSTLGGNSVTHIWNLAFEHCDLTSVSKTIARRFNNSSMSKL